MNIIINNKSMQPIYEQIVESIKSMILNKQLPEGSFLPSVRGLAKDLKISALTVKKAYDFLEEEGYIATIHGKGSYVLTINRNLAYEEVKKEVEILMEQALTKARVNQLSKEDVTMLFQLVMEDTYD